MRVARSVLELLMIAVVSVSFAEAKDPDASKPAQSADKDAKPSDKDAEKFSYYLGYRNGKNIVAKPELKPADNDAFLRGVKVALGLEELRAEDKDNADCKKGADFGAQFAAFRKQRFPFLDQSKAVEGVHAAIANKQPSYAEEELKEAADACAKFIRTPSFPPNPLLGKAAPKWNVGPWHQLPDGKTSLDISDVKGKVLYIFCFQSWCPGCHKRGFPALKQLSEKYEEDEGVCFVAFQTVFEDRADKPVNTFDNLKLIAKKYDLDIPFAQSGSREDKSELMKAYKTRGTPWAIVVDKKGVIRFSSFHIEPEEAIKLIEKLKAETDEVEPERGDSAELGTN